MYTRVEWGAIAPFWRSEELHKHLVSKKLFMCKKAVTHDSPKYKSLRGLHCRPKESFIKQMQNNSYFLIFPVLL